MASEMTAEFQPHRLACDWLDAALRGDSRTVDHIEAGLSQIDLQRLRLSLASLAASAVRTATPDPLRALAVLRLELAGRGLL